jgi:thiamine-phosphate pyrophosphorylase
MLFDLVRDAVSAAKRSETAIFVNDRADVARSAGADGVHLPEGGLAPEVVKRIFPELLVGVSTHDLAGAVRASEAGADLIYFGPIFETPGKGKPVGLDVLASVCRGVAAPVVALGGIDEGNFQAALDAGAAGIAAIRALNDAESRRRVLARLRAG